MTSKTSAQVYEDLKELRRSGELEQLEAKVVRAKLTPPGYRELRKNGVFLVPGFAKIVVVKKPLTKAKGINPFVGEELYFRVKPVRVEKAPTKAKAARKVVKANRGKAGQGYGFRTLEIQALADRVFGDEAKAEVWLQRPNSSLSGQKPANLLKDELGTAVVREMLERIDHGVFA